MIASAVFLGDTGYGYIDMRRRHIERTEGNTYNESRHHNPNHQSLVEKAVRKGHDSHNFPPRTTSSRPKGVRNTVDSTSEFQIGDLGEMIDPVFDEDVYGHGWVVCPVKVDHFR
jgi:hypothetical protein